MELRKKQKQLSSLRTGATLVAIKWAYLAILVTLHLQKPRKKLLK